MWFVMLSTRGIQESPMIHLKHGMLVSANSEYCSVGSQTCHATRGVQDTYHIKEVYTLCLEELLHQFFSIVEILTII